MIVGLYQPNGGKIYLNDEEITALPMYLRARKGIGYLPQEPSVFRKLTTEENLMAILETLPLSREARKERLEKLLNELGLTLSRRLLSSREANGGGWKLHGPWCSHPLSSFWTNLFQGLIPSPYWISRALSVN
jgi:ABC-type lipopolysaccharide export system ATPase subunit